MLMFLASSCVLILLLIALRPFMKKRVSPLVRYSLWLLVALRLLVPFQFGSSTFSLENLFRDEAPTVQVEVQTSPQTNIGAENPTYFDSVEIQRPQTVIPETIPFEQEESIGSPTLSPMQEVPTTDPMGSLIQEERRHLSPTVPQILNGIWFVGFLSMALWFLAVNIRFGKKAKVGATKVETTGMPIPVYETGSIPSPCMTGLIRPRIYLLPCKAPRQQAHILTHEYTHYRHLDHIWSLVRGLCLCVHWFNPLVWIAAYLSKEDCELACDHSAIQALGEEERIPYGRTLLDTLVQANRPGNLLRSATTMGGGKKQIRTRLEAIVSKPKKLLWALLCLILVVALSVGCTFTGGKNATQAPEEDPAEATETTVPNDTEDVTFSDQEDHYFNMYEDSTYDGSGAFGDIVIRCIYKDENYEIPEVIKLFESSSDSTSYIEQVNSEIIERYGMIVEGDHSQYKSVTYRWNVATLAGVDCCCTGYFDHADENKPDHWILILDITAIDHHGKTETHSYYIDRSQKDAVLRSSNYNDKIQDRITETLIQELYNEYANTGKISFTEQDYAIYKENLSKAVENATVKVLSHNSVTFTVPYVTMDGSVRDLDLNPMPTESISVNAIYEPKVIDLYTYTADDGSVCTLPFVLLDNERGIQLNTEILWNYLHHLPPQASYTWAVHGDIISFSMKAQDPHTFGLMCMAENLYTDPTKDGTPDKEYVLSQAKTPMTYKEYKDKARILFPSYFFDLFPGITEQFPNDQMVLQQVIRCGSSVNIDLSTPYLDEKGNVWAMGKIYQIAGSESTINLIPISTGKVNEEYRAFAEANHFSMTAEETLLSYLECLYGAGNYDLIYTAEQAYPEYVDDKIHAESYAGELLITIYRELTPTLTGQDLVDIPELKAATDLLGVKKIIYGAYPSQIIGDKVTAYSMIIANSNFTKLYDPYVELVWDVDLNAVHILIHPGL